MSKKKEEKIFERNPDTGEIKSRPVRSMEQVMEEMVRPIVPRIRAEMLDEIWAAPKVNHQGHWYVRLSDVTKIIES